MNSPQRQVFLLATLFQLIFAFPFYSQEYKFDKLSLEDGLSSNSVYRIEQDAIGYMWFGTFSGLNRYDGNEIRTYKPEPGNSRSISNPLIFDLFEDSQRRLWVATDGGGLNLYNKHSDDFTVFRHDSKDKNSISSNNVYALCEDREKKIWIGTGGGGLNYYDEINQQFISFRDGSGPNNLESDVIRVVYCDFNGILWIGTENGGLSRMNYDGSFTTFRTDSHNSRAISSDTVRSLFEDSMGNFWIGTEGGGLNLFDRKTLLFSTIGNKRLISPFHYSVRSINEDNEGNIWIGTEGQGVFVINKKGDLQSSIRSRLEDSSSLSKDKIRDLFLDRNGMMWIGTRDGGVNRYNPVRIGFRVTGERDIREIYEDSSGNIWIGSDGGGVSVTNKADRSSIKYLHLNEGNNSLSNNQVYTILEDHEGYVWIGTDGGGLNRLDKKDNSFSTYTYSANNPYSINSNTVWSLLEDSKGILWIGTEGGGLNYFDRQSGQFHSFLSIPEREDTLNGNSIRSIFEDSDQNLWIGTWDGGLNLFNYDEKNFVRYTREPKKIQSLSDSSVNTIFEDSTGRLWIGTAAGGLNLMDKEKGVFTHYSTNEGLSGDNVFGILEDKEGNLWISTDRGLTKFNPSSGEILNFGKTDGLLGNEFSVNACTRLESGEMLFGGPKGINRFFPEKVYVNRSIPPLVITNVSVMNQSINYIQENDSQLVLTHDDYILTVSFAVLDFAEPKRNRYSVIMEGLHEEWTNLENTNSIVYTSLPHGEYTLRIKGADNNGIWNEEGAFLKIKVKPPWWRTLLFYWSVLFLLSALIFSFIKFRLYRLEMKNKELREYSIHIQDVREEERTSVAREVHDELGQTLSALKMEIYRENGTDQNSMLELINSSLESVKDLSTKLRPKVLDNLKLEEAVSWLVGDFSERSGIRAVKHLSESLNIKDNEIKTALFRISQEILTNVSRHSGADTVEISLHRQNETIQLDFRDNGCGISEKAYEKNRSFGIRGMKERCRHLGGLFKISEAPGGGTAIRVILPVRLKCQNA